MRGYRIGAVLAGIAIVPLIGAGWFATADVIEARNERAQIALAAESVEELIALSELRAELFDELMWRATTAFLTTIDVPIGLAASVTGIDIERELDDATQHVDELVERLGLGDSLVDLDEARAAGSDAIDIFGTLHGQLAAQVETRTQRLLDDALDDAEHLQGGAVDRSLTLLEGAATARGLVSQEFLAYFFVDLDDHLLLDDRNRAESIASLLTYGAQRRGEVALLAGTAELGSRVATQLDRLAASPEANEFDARIQRVVARSLGEDDASGGSLQGLLIDGAAMFETTRATSEAYFDVVVAAGDDARTAAREASSTAVANYRRAVTVLGVLVLVSLGVAFLATRAIAAPIRRLSDAARDIRDGRRLDTTLTDDGPTEVRAAAQALREAAQQLDLAEQQALALADGDLKHPSLGATAPGALGSSLQDAVRTLRGSLEEREHLRRRMAHEASHDGLTQLANRNASIQMLERGLARTRRSRARLAVLFIDLDDFKGVNDQRGHPAGDHVLRIVAERLVSTVRPGDHVGRLGGDEFLVIAEPVDGHEDARSLAETIHAAVCDSITVEGVAVAVGATIGVAVSGHEPTTASEILHDADLALYRAKRLGRGRIEVCDDELRSMMAELADLESATRTAIDDDEFELHFQPILDADTHDLVSFEALLRWDRPGNGPIPPGVFIPVAERSDLITDVDRWVVERLARQLRAWCDERRFDGVPVSINISGRHLASPYFVDSIVTPLADHGVPFDRVILEITEGALLDDLWGAAEKLEQLRSRGIRVAIDDFGTGFTSLAHLRNLPLDILKIDRSFIADEDATSLIQLIIDAGHLLGASVTAEGIETDDAAARLTGMGADDLQGFLFARPQSVDELREWDESGRRVEPGGPAPAMHATA